MRGRREGQRTPWQDAALAYSLWKMGRHEENLAEMRKAIRLEPGNARFQALFGWYLGFAGRAEEGIEPLRLARRMSPHSAPLLFWLGATYRAAGRFDKAIDLLKELRVKRGGRILPGPELQLAATYQQAGREEDARATVQAVLKVAPRFTLEFVSRRTPYKRPEDTKAFLGALRKAGLPE